MTIDPASGLIEFTPDYDDSGVYPVTVEVDDGFNPPITESFMLTVTQTLTGIGSLPGERERSGYR